MRPWSVPEVAGQTGGGDRLGLGQVVTLGLLGQLGLHDVERGEVGSVLVGPVHPDPDQRARGQVHPGGVLLVAGQHQRVSDVPPSTAIWSRCLTARATSRAVPLRGVRAECAAITELCLAGGRAAALRLGPPTGRPGRRCRPPAPGNV